MATNPPSTSAHSEPGDWKQQLMTLLEIPSHLSIRNDRNIRVAYSKYKAYLQASQTLTGMVTDGSWPGKKPSATDLIEVFVSKSMWFSHYKPGFSKVADYPDMVEWLEGGDEIKSDLEVWGVEKSAYSLLDLKKFVDNGTLAEKKGKGKKGKNVGEASGSKGKMEKNVGESSGSKGKKEKKVVETGSKGKNKVTAKGKGKKQK